jgi:hypothetical protein
MKPWTVATFGSDSDEFVGEDIYDLMLMFSSLQPAESQSFKDRVEYRINPSYICNPSPNCRYASLLVDPVFHKVKATTYHCLGYEPLNIKRSGLLAKDYNNLTISVYGVIDNDIRLDPKSLYSDVSYIESYTINSFLAWERNCRYILQKKRMCPLRTENNSLAFREKYVYQVELWIEGFADRELVLQIIKSSCPRPLQGYFLV